MNYVISLVKEIVKKRKMIADLALADFKKMCIRDRKYMARMLVSIFLIQNFRKR